ncbi:MAG: bifunctional (p)ppGpp synthetase/guanosine-3',5'-bis(diphosphate) 3'-pyrophosphohydrolase [Bacteroidales bacterium]|nr:bifunctional (p)ppGpp synthetase/guanosine-3',5'-bis(diphosphate) 3'-pyrophosphohydrolase [Bacteroidales bacterium]
MSDKEKISSGISPVSLTEEQIAANRLRDDELRRLPGVYRELLGFAVDMGDVSAEDISGLRAIMTTSEREGHFRRDKFGNSSLLRSLATAAELCRSVSPDRHMVIAILLYPLCLTGHHTAEEVEERWGEDIARMVRGLLKVSSLYERGGVAVESENFRRLLMTFADDIRVIIIMIVDRLVLMKAINHHPNEKLVRDVAYEANYLYASLAHRLGLYSIKSELEDMSLKYTDRATYTSIARQLNERKNARDAYIESFIGPIKEKLEGMGLKFDIKGRTKSIFSIWNKMRKQKNDIDHIYDLFAIRIILDTPPEKEKSDCWMVYSVITDMYQPNPSRMKDWISIPKSNGYESLHITVAGPEGKWVEVQIRTRRMDLVAEKGLAAHWRYKGIKSESNLDAWMNNVRDILETAHSGPLELMRNFKMDIYDKEVFVFTPKGDLYRLPAGASLLDFAFNIHSRLGCSCVGGRVNGKNEKITYKLRSGDTVEIQTSSSQQPKADWLNYVVTSKARSKIRQTLKEQQGRTADLGRELLERRFKNRKIDLEESTLSRLIKKLGFKNSTDFFSDIAEGRLDVNSVAEKYMTFEAPVKDNEQHSAPVSAEEFTLRQSPDAPEAGMPSSDVLVIGNDIKGISYKFAKCCNPIYGDDVFGFISSEGVIKIHRTDCPNARNIRERYPYRMITTRWSGKIGEQFAVTLRVVGRDDIGIVTNITSIINKEKNVSLRSISIDSHDGLFQGHLVIGIADTRMLGSLIKKIGTVKGVKDVERVN